MAKDRAEQYLKQVPEDFDSKQLHNYDLIIAMERRYRDVVLNKCPECEDKIVVWGIEDPYFRSPVYAGKIYEQIKEKVIELANSL